MTNRYQYPVYNHKIHSLPTINYRTSSPLPYRQHPEIIHRLFINNPEIFKDFSSTTRKYSDFSACRIVLATGHQYPGNFQRLATSNQPASSIPAASSYHPASSFPAATSNHPATSSSNQQQQSTEAINYSNQQQSTAAIDSSNQQQQQARATSSHLTSSTYTINASNC